MTWALVKSQGRTVYHRRRLPGDAWCTVVQRELGAWEWGVRVRPAGKSIGELVRHGRCSTWQNARRAADEAAAALKL